MTSIVYPAEGSSPFWQDAVTDASSLPPSGTIGEVRLTLDTKDLYEWDGASWVLILNASGTVIGPASSTDNALALFDGTTGKLLKAASAITASRALASDVNGVPVAAATTATELGYVNGVTSSIQTQLNGKEPSITILPIVKGGTNSAASLNNNRVIVSTSGAIVESAAITASRALASDANGIPVAAATTATELSYVNGVTSSIQTQLNGKEPSITVLPIVKGGTNSGATLNNNRIVVTTGSAIVESAAITASRALASDVNGIPVAATTTATELGYVNGVTSSIQTQLNAKEPSITVLPVAKGGTGSGTSLNNNRVIVSTSGLIVEAQAITASRALASDVNGIPVAAATTATELSYVNGVTSSIQTQLDAKEPTISILPIVKGGTNSSTALSNNLVMISAGGKVVESATTSTELGYVSGVTSAIQTQFTNIRAIKANVSVTTDVTLTNNAMHFVATSSARALTLPAPSATLFLVIKDVTGSAQTNNITVSPASGTIDGAATFVLDYNYGAAQFVSDGTNYFVA